MHWKEGKRTWEEGEELVWRRTKVSPTYSMTFMKRLARSEGVSHWSTWGKVFRQMEQSLQRS